MIGSLIVALVGAGLLWWDPARGANLLAVAVIGFAIAPIFPALMSGTSGRVGVHYAANTIGVQMAATGLGLAIVPSSVGVLADRVSLEVVPVCLLGLFAGVLGLYAVGEAGEVEGSSNRKNSYLRQSSTTDRPHATNSPALLVTSVAPEQEQRSRRFEDQTARSQAPPSRSSCADGHRSTAASSSNASERKRGKRLHNRRHTAVPVAILFGTVQQFRSHDGTGD